jgi:hypothetical protein
MGRDNKYLTKRYTTLHSTHYTTQHTQRWRPVLGWVITKEDRPLLRIVCQKGDIWSVNKMINNNKINKNVCYKLLLATGKLPVACGKFYGSSNTAFNNLT